MTTRAIQARCAVLAVLACLSSDALAQRYIATPYSYVLMSAGTSRASFECSGASTCGRSDTGVKLVGGVVVMPGLAVELSRLSFGDTTTTIATQPSGLTSSTLSVDGFGVGAALSTDMREPVYGIARLGMASLSVSPRAPAVTRSERSYAPYLGGAVGWQFASHWAVEAAVDMSWAQFSGRTANVRMLTAGLRYRF